MLKIKATDPKIQIREGFVTKSRLMLTRAKLYFPFFVSLKKIESNGIPFHARGCSRP